MTEELYKECIALINAYYEDQEYAQQGSFSRAQWAVEQLAKDLGMIEDK